MKPGVLLSTAPKLMKAQHYSVGVCVRVLGMFLGFVCVRKRVSE